ncbi:MAG TPA: helix-turn-helix transcriptional regulator [Lachnospiraceae bacterium]|nr:helix-turn-helix transcriptional regulator [Lachnospiraceae bacterium]
MDKEKLGSFVAALRKEQGMTQKELAEKLCLTDKAVSKWERGLSYPDISMLEPMAEVLGVSVLELLQGERIREDASLTVEEAKKVVDSSLIISDQEIASRHARSKSAFLFCCVVVMFLISFLLNIINFRSQTEHSGESFPRVEENANTAYQTEEREGTLYFVNPEAALEQLLLDNRQYGDSEAMEEYQLILERSFEGEDF